MLGYDPHKLSSPQVFLLSMLVFLAIVAFIAAILTRQISPAFVTNPGLNGLIVGVLVVGILLAFAQVVRLFREVRWVNSFRAGSEATEPVLLAPMKALLSRSSTMALSTSSMRTMLDSIANRLDESRDISRYLIGLLVFLGLLGTFWGLLATIGSIGDTIQSLDPGSGDTSAVLDALKSGLAAPLAGMGTAFSSSLFGLSGSLVLGFLDLQAGRAQTRFYTELENWLSTVTDLSSDIIVADPRQGRLRRRDPARSPSGCARCRRPAAPTRASPPPWPISPTAFPASSRTCAPSSRSCATGSRRSRRSRRRCAARSKRSPTR